MKNMRKRIYSIIETSDGDDWKSELYDWLMSIVILVSLAPLTVKATGGIWRTIDAVSACVFTADYALRLATADFKLRKGIMSFFIYPFTPLAIFDILAILPTITALNGGLRVLKVIRATRSLRVLRIVKSFRYSKNISMMADVVKKQKDSLAVVGALAIGYILVSALVVFNVEPDTFDNFFAAVYWAVVSLTTVGYGDIYPTSTAGRIVAMVSSLIGIAIVALPASILTAGYMDELQKESKETPTPPAS